MEAVPDAEELSDLKATQELFKSNIFKLQLDDLVQEVQIDKKKTTKLEAWLHGLKEVLDGLPLEFQEVPMPPQVLKNTYQMKFFKGEVKHEEKKVKGSKKMKKSAESASEFKMKFQRPSRVDIVGSYLLDTTCRPILNIDVSIEIPKDCLQPKDFQNFRYFDKRATYLHYVLKALESSSDYKEAITIEYFQKDPNKPILVLAPKLKGVGKHYSVRLFPCVSVDTFPGSKLSPDKCCCKKETCSLVSQDSDTSSSTTNTPTPEHTAPTPYYNMSVLEDTGFREHLAELHHWASESPAFAHTVLLFKVWMRARGLHRAGLNGFLCSMLLAHLLLSRNLGKQMSTYQMFRSTMTFLTQADFAKGVAMKPQEGAPAADLGVYARMFEATFVDRSGYFNLFFRVSRSTCTVLKREASLTLSCLDNTLQDGFEPIFLKPVEFELKYDMYFTVLPDSTTLTALGGEPAINPHAVFGRRVFELLTQALGTRVTLIDVRLEGDRAMVGLILSPDGSREALDVGPAADDKVAATAFRKLWGPLSKIRRFKDGRIVECVSWEGDGTPHQIVRQVVAHILNRHLSVASQAISFVGYQLDAVMASHTQPAHLGVGLDAAGEKVLAAFKSLDEMIRSVDLPLSFLAFQAVHPVLRGTAVFPPPRILPSSSENDPTYAVEPIPVVVQFESSTKWPDDLLAIARIKTAFYLRMANLLQNTHKVKSSCAHTFLDVAVQGLAFRITIFHDRELMIHQQDARDQLTRETIKAAMAKGVAPVLKGPEFDEANTTAGRNTERDCVHRPWLASSLKAFTGRFPWFGPAARIVKRWLCAHMLSDCIAEEATELLVAYSFINSAPYPPPCSILSGLLRFLQLVTSFNFAKNPIIVDVLGDMTQPAMTAIETRFKSRGDARPAMCIFTAKDNESVWTSKKPSNLQLERIIAYAHSSLSYLKNLLSSSLSAPTSSVSSDKLWLSLFRTPLQQYDLLISLDPAALPKYTQGLVLPFGSRVEESKKRKFKLPPGSAEAAPLPMVGFDPVYSYLSDLRAQVAHLCDFYYDAMGGAVIGVCWKPEVMVPQAFAVSRATLAEPVEDASGEGLIRPNVEAIMHFFKVAGRGLVKDVYRGYAAFEAGQQTR